MSQPPAGGYPPPPDQNPYGAPPAAGQPVPPPAGYPAAPPPAGYPAAPPPGAYQQPTAPAAPPGPPPGYAPPPGAGYQPPAGGYPPPPPGAGYPQPGAPVPGAYPGAPAPAAGPSFNAANVAIGDWVVIGTAVVLLIFSFFGWLSASYSYGGFGASLSYGAWHEYWWLATLLGLVVGVVFALRALAGQSLQQIKPLFVLIAAGLGFLITLIALIEIFTKGDSGPGYSVGPGFGIWICLIVSLAQTYFVWLWGQSQAGWTLPKLPGPVLWK